MRDWAICSPSLVMDTPYSIASLPKPLDADHGRIHAAPVYGLRGSRKRKRHEVAVGVDGEGVNIYNVRMVKALGTVLMLTGTQIQTQTNVASHALPPQSYLCGPPCSVYCRSTITATSQRRTYLVLRDGHQDKKRRLVCFIADDSPGTPALGSQLAPPRKKECKLRNEDIVAVDVLPSSLPESEGKSSVVVVVAYSSGHVDCIAGDLSCVLWTHDAADECKAAGSDSKVEYAITLDLDTARRGLLAGRDDVVAALDPVTSGAPSPNLFLLCQLVQAAESCHLLLSTICPNDQLGHRPGLAMILDINIPHGQRLKNNATYELHAASGRLYQLTEGLLTIFDLSGTVSKVQNKLGSSLEPVLDFARISNSSVLALAPGRAILYETKYGSVQQSTSLILPISIELAVKKRKRSEDRLAAAAMSPIISFSDLNLVVGLVATELMACQVGKSELSAKRTRSSGILLVDVLSNGAAVGTNKPAFGATTDEAQKAAWDQWKKEADLAVATNEDWEFEKLVAETLQLESSPIPPDARQLLIEAGDGMQGPPDTELAEIASFDTHRIDRRRAIYLLGNCFRMAAEEERAATWHGSLFIHTVASANTLRYFALTGFLTAEDISRALDLSSGTHTEAHIGPGDVMDAIGRFDTDFDLMHTLLASPVNWDIAEIVQAAKLLSESFESILGSRQHNLTSSSTGPHTNGDLDVTMTNGDTDPNLEYELRAAEFALSHAFAELDSSPEGLREILYEIFRRLSAFPKKNVVVALRKMLSHQDLIRFISALRLELALGGWISRYTDYPDDNDAGARLATAEDTFSTPSDSAVHIVGSLLSSAIDAIGTSGWLIAGIDGDATKTQDMINALRAEVTAGVEGCYEAEALDRYLREVDRYAVSARDREQDRELETRHVVVSPDLDVELDARAIEEVMMPLGPSAGMRKEGKTARLQKLELSKRVGRYSIERIRI